MMRRRIAAISLAAAVAFTGLAAAHAQVRGGTWGKAIEVPGDALLAISCTSVSQCSAGGYYSDQARHAQAFVVSRT